MLNEQRHQPGSSDTTGTPEHWYGRATYPACSARRASAGPPSLPARLSLCPGARTAHRGPGGALPRFAGTGPAAVAAQTVREW